MITTNTTVRWSDPNGSPLVGVVVAIDGTDARVATPYGLTLTVALDKLKPMTTARLNIQPDSIRWEEKNPAAVELGRKGGAAKVPKGLSMHSTAQRKASAAKAWVTRRAKATATPAKP